MPALALLLLTGCSAHRTLLQQVAAEHWCSEDQVYVFADDGATLELSVCGHRRVYRPFREGSGRHAHRVWRDVTPARFALPAAWPRPKPAVDGCSGAGLEQMRAAGVSSSAIAFACDVPEAPIAVPRDPGSADTFARGVTPAWPATAQPMLAAARCSDAQRAEMERFGMSASAITSACDTP